MTAANAVAGARGGWEALAGGRSGKDAPVAGTARTAWT